MSDSGIVCLIQLHKIWRKQCQATRTIRRRFGLKNGLDYLLREKLLWTLPKWPSSISSSQLSFHGSRLLCTKSFIHPYELAGYLASLRPVTRKKLQMLLFVRGAARVAG
jgi:hypothetical protein